MLPNPRLKVCIHSSVTTRQDTLTISLLELALENLIAAVCLRGIAIQSILILNLIVMSIARSQ